MARRSSGLAALTDYVRRNPRTAAIAAFNLGLYAATLTRKGVRRGELAELPAKLVDLVPSMRDLMSLLGQEEEVPRKRSSNRRKAGARKATGRRSRGTGNGGER